MAEGDHNSSHAALAEFCSRLALKSGADSADLAIGVLCWHDQRNRGIQMSTWDLTKILTSHGLGNPNRATLAAKLSKSPLTMKLDGKFRVRAGAEHTIRELFAGAFDPAPPQLNLEDGYLPLAVWKATRGYLEKVCTQLNGCYQFTFYDAASVMLRRSIETLIIEAYEHLHREVEVKDADGNYFMLGELVNRSISATGLTLGREARAALKEIKKLGDRSAHNRRYNAVKADLDDIRSGVRVAVDELINIASLRRAR